MVGTIEDTHQQQPQTLAPISVDVIITYCLDSKLTTPSFISSESHTTAHRTAAYPPVPCPHPASHPTLSRPTAPTYPPYPFISAIVIILTHTACVCPVCLLCVCSTVIPPIRVCSFHHNHQQHSHPSKSLIFLPCLITITGHPLTPAYPTDPTQYRVLLYYT